MDDSEVIDNPEEIDFTLPADHPATEQVFNTFGGNVKKGLPKIYVGCAKWNKKDLKNFYPEGVKDELSYYSTQFNCIEMNASFYRIFSPEQFAKWKEKTPRFLTERLVIRRYDSSSSTIHWPFNFGESPMELKMK